MLDLVRMEVKKNINPKIPFIFFRCLNFIYSVTFLSDEAAEIKPWLAGL